MSLPPISPGLELYAGGLPTARQRNTRYNHRQGGAAEPSGHHDLQGWALHGNASPDRGAASLPHRRAVLNERTGQDAVWAPSVAVRRFRAQHPFRYGHIADSCRYSRRTCGSFPSSEAIPMVWEGRSVKPPAQPTPGSPGTLPCRGPLRTTHARSRARGPGKPLGRFRLSAASRCCPPAGAFSWSGCRWRARGAFACSVRPRARHGGPGSPPPLHLSDRVFTVWHPRRALRDWGSAHQPILRDPPRGRGETRPTRCRQGRRQWPSQPSPSEHPGRQTAAFLAPGSAAAPRSRTGIPAVATIRDKQQALRQTRCGRSRTVVHVPEPCLAVRTGLANLQDRPGARFFCVRAPPFRKDSREAWSFALGELDADLVGVGMLQVLEDG
jgi:hypothetical protein